ncbi:F-box only protein 30b [Electrophorus electricus]|uniref:F-box protein 30b n=1 Tax=Electrophorus electricus TaxID=8005 RepID=A0A4W4E4B7_ELEEL|nr:F-box only protein 30b [Electrophorus electricus]
MEGSHIHCVSCVNRRCMVKPEPGTSCDLITCPLVCGAIFHGCKADEHRLLCPLERVPCLNHGIGCPFVLARSKMVEHLEVCPAGVVCCTMEWNRWPVHDEDYRSYERLSRDADEEEQLDMALALQDQRTMLASLKLVSLAPTSGPERKLQAPEQSRKPGGVVDSAAPAEPAEYPADRAPAACCSKEETGKGMNGLVEEHCGELYQTTAEANKSLTAALDILIQLNASDAQRTATDALPAQTGVNGELHKDLATREATDSNCAKIANGVDGLNEELQPQRQQTLMELGRNLATALEALGDAVKGPQPISSPAINNTNGGLHQSDDVESADVEMVDAPSEVEAELGAVGQVSDEGMDMFCDYTGEELSQESSGQLLRLCSSCHNAAAPRAESQEGARELAVAGSQGPEPNGSLEFGGPLIPHRPQVRHVLAPVVMQEASGAQAPLLQAPVHAQALVVPGDGVLPSAALNFDDRAFERKLQNLQMLRSLMPLALNRRKVCFSDAQAAPHRSPRCKMEDKAVDTSDLEQEPRDDPMGLGEIDFTAAALLFCLEESPRARRISDTVYAFGGSRVDFGTQTFSFPAAILATSTMVGEVASASACDRAAPRLSQPSPFCTLRLDLTLEQLVPRPSWAPREGSMFTFECGQLFRREEFLSHFRNVHGDIHSGLNGWMEHRCPLAYYGCTYSQRRFCPSARGAKVVHDRRLRSFGVQAVAVAPTEPGCDRLSGLPFEILQHVARFLDGFSLCQLSMVSRTMRDVCASLLQTRGMVVVQWEKKLYPDGRRSWQIKDKVWRFSTAFAPVARWEFTDICSMADHLKRCPYNEVHRQVEAVPLPCMCTTRELTRDGRSLRSVLKPVL